MGLDTEIPNVINYSEHIAKKILQNNSLDNYRILYKDTTGPNGIVIDQKVDRNGILNIFVGTKSIAYNLPGSYQRNQSLKNYLMIFQHFNNSFNNKLDNIHNFFNPMVTDKKALFWLSSWFSLEIGTDLPENRYRMLIREIVTLYQWRGTKYGLERILEIISGSKPEITEGGIDINNIEDDSISFTFSENIDGNNEINIIFPLSQKQLGGKVVKTIFSIVEKEKPAHIQCRILFAPDEVKEKDAAFRIGEVTVMEDSRL